MRGLIACAVCVSSVASAQSATLGVTFDRWNYPFNFTPGFREAASTFGSGFVPGQFDDRDAQILNSFSTASAFAVGAGAENYIITQARMTATITGGEFLYSSTYQEGASIDLFGTGFRNGLNAFAFNDSGAFSFGDPLAEDVRNAYATDNAGGSLRDVSNNVRDGFTPNAFSIGQIAGAIDGETITGAGQQIVFDLDLGNADVVSYLQQSLNQGIVSLSVTSLHEAPVMGGGASTFPIFGLSEGGNGATLELTVQVIPAPGATAVLAGFGLLAARRRR